MRTKSKYIRIVIVIVFALITACSWTEKLFASVWCWGETVNPPAGPPGSPPPPCKTCNGTGSPVFVRKGDYVFSLQDLQLPTRGFLLSVNRNYESLRASDGVLGIGWTSNFTVRVNFSTYLYSAPSTYIKEADVLMPDGRLYQFTQNGDGTFTPPTGSHDTLVKNADGTYDLTPQLTRSRYHFSSVGLLQSMTDDYGNSLSFSYDGNGRLQQVSDATGSGRYLNFYYGPDGRLSTVQDSSNRQVQYGYDTNGTLTTFTDPAGRVNHYAYNAQGYYSPMLTSISNNWNRLITTITYDSSYRVQAYTEGGETYTYVYGTGEPMTISKTDSLGTRFFIADSNGLITSEWFYAAPAKTTTYNPDGSAALFTDELGVKTHYIYNANGSIASLTRDEGGTLAVRFDYAYDTNFSEKVVSITPKNPSTGAINPDWQAWRYDYYPSGSAAPGALNHVYRVESDGSTLDTLSTYTYNSAGQVLSVTDGSGSVTSYNYNTTTGDLISVIYPANSTGGGTRTYQYGRDAVGRVSSVTDPAGKITSYVYDFLDRITSVTLPKPSPSSPLNFVTTYSYDNYDSVSGLLFTNQTDANGKITKQGFDQYGHLIQSIDAANRTTSFGYTNGLLTTITDANGNVTTYHYYDNTRRLNEIDSLNGRETYAYNADGTLKNHDDPPDYPPGCCLHNYFYDSLKRRTEEDFPNSGALTFNYVGQKLTSTYSSSTGQSISYTYDASYRKASETQGSLGTINYTYDSSDRVASYSLAGAPSATYAYYPDGSLNTITWSLVSGSFQYNYTSNGQYSSITFPNGQHRDYGYDDQGRLLQIANVHPVAGNLATYNYDYDIDNSTGLFTMLGQRTAMTATVPTQGFSGSQTKYYYDANYQLVRADYPNVSPFNGEIDSWTYDPIGNRLTNTVNGITTNYTYRTYGGNPNNDMQLSSDGVNSYIYSPTGNVGFGPGTQLFWDGLNRLAWVGYYNGDPATYYKYDSLNRRVNKTTTISVDYLYDGQNLIRSKEPIDTYDFLFGPGIDEPLAVSKNSGSPQYYDVDGLGSVALLNDTNGGILNNYVYDAWGVVKSQTGTFSNPFTYTAREPSPEAFPGLMYYRARYYSPQIGRFISEDRPATARSRPSYGLAAALHAYSYVENDPVNWIDPRGLAKKRPPTRWEPCIDPADVLECEIECMAIGKEYESCRKVWIFKVVGLKDGKPVNDWWERDEPECTCKDKSCDHGCQTALTVILGILVCLGSPVGI